MKKTFLLAMVLTGIMLDSCTRDDDDYKSGSIYGIVTLVDSTEPIKGVGISLYTYENPQFSNKIMTTTIFDDGSYEFKDMPPGNYRPGDDYYYYYIGIESEKYRLMNSNAYGTITVKVVDGRQTKVDILVAKMK